MQKQSFTVGRGGVKSLRTGGPAGGLKNFRTSSGGLLLLGGSVPHYKLRLFQISHNCVTECTMQARFLLKLKSLIKS